MQFFFDAFKRVFELSLEFEPIPNVNMLSIALIVVTVWSVFRFLVFPLFTRESLDNLDHNFRAFHNAKVKARNNARGRGKK